MRRRQVSRTQTTSLARRFATPSVTKRYFLPTSIAGCQLWLDASDSSSVVMTGTNVTTWKDKSGNGYHMDTLTPNATWTGTAVYPTIGTSINGLQTVNFTAQGGLKQSTTLDGVKTLFWVGRIAAPVGSGASFYFLLGHDSAYDWCGQSYGGKFIDVGFSPSGITGASPASLFTSDANAVTNATFSNVSMPSAPNISLLSVAGITGTTRYQGICYDRDAHVGWCGDLAEVITFTTALTTSQRQAVEGYLAHKWGLTKYYSPSFPLSISGCQLWLDAADSSSLTLSGNTVTSWRDKSGNGLNVSAASSQPTYLTNAANGLGTLAFNGSQGLNAGIVRGDKLIGNTGSCAIFVVVRFANTSGRSMPFSWDDETYTSRLLFQNSQTSEIALDQGPFPNNRTNATVSLSNNLYYIFSYSQNGSNTKLNRNGITIASLTNFSTTTIASSSRLFNVGPYINGSEWNMNGNIAEILFFNTNIPNKFQEVEIYLARKWGITIAEPLPSSHPYLNFIPGSLKEFVPTSLSGCQLWLDGADSSTVAGTTTVTQWRDKSGNTRHLGVGSGTTSYSSKAIQLANSYMFVTSPIDLTKVSVFIVAKTTGGNNQTVFSARPDAGFSWSSLDGFGFYMDSQSSIRFYGELSNNSSFNVNTSTPQLFSFQSSGTSISGRYNGTSQSGGTLTSSRTSTAKGFAIGGEWHRDQNEYINFVANASIYEIITYNTDLTTNQLQQVEGYLALKWGLTGSLPSGHPYKAFSPYLSLTPTFLPTLIPGCQLWLDGADQSSMTLSGSSITQLRDKSGNGNHMVNNGTSPLYNSSLINSVGGIDCTNGGALISSEIQNSANISFAMVAVVKSGIRNWSSFFTHGDRDYDFAVERQENTSSINFQTANDNSSCTITFTLDAPVLYFGTMTSGTSRFFESFSGGVNTIVTGTNPSTISLGSKIIRVGKSDNNNEPCNSFIGEIIYYTTVLTTTQRQQVESYLAWKWGLQTSLPSDHTYKFAPPSV